MRWKWLFGKTKEACNQSLLLALVPLHKQQKEEKGRPLVVAFFWGRQRQSLFVLSWERWSVFQGDWGRGKPRRKDRPRPLCWLPIASKGTRKKWKKGNSGWEILFCFDVKDGQRRTFVIRASLLAKGRNFAAFSSKQLFVLGNTA